MNTIENNKLIAGFMGGIFVTYKDEEQVKIKVPRNSIIQMPFWNLAYDSDWEWLMEVVSKIESLGNDVVITSNYIQITYDEGEQFITIELEGNIRLIAVYNACLDFIKWYNLQEGV